MRTKTAALALLAGAVLALPLAHAQDKPDPDKDTGKTKLPLNPFANAKEGQWVVFSVTVGGDAEMPQPTGPSILRVKKVSGDSVTSNFSEGGEEAKDRSFSKKDGPSLEYFFEIPSETAVTNFTVEDAKKNAGGKDCACKKVSFDFVPGDVTVHLEAYMCPDLPLGIAGFDVTITTQDKKKATMHYELAGYGTGDKADWGKTPDQVAKDMQAATPPPPPPAPPPGK